jgi:hypothetical protein
MFLRIRFRTCKYFVDLLSEKRKDMYVGINYGGLEK